MSKKQRKEAPAPKGEDWAISETTAERLLDLFLALIVLCAILCWSLVTFSVKSHIVLIILAPLLFYFTISSPGTRLRLKERRSALIVTDVITVFEIALCCLYTDYVYATQADNMVPLMIFCIVSAVLLCFYLSRSKFMYRLILPVLFVTNIVIFTLADVDVVFGVMLTFLLPLPYCTYTYRHPYYFGFGRVEVKGKYRYYPEKIAKRMRAKQAEERKAERLARIRQKSKS